MIKLHILEKMMQVVTTVSKAIRTVKDKVHQVSKVIESNRKHAKEEKDLNKKESAEASFQTQLTPKKPLISKAKLFKQMVYLVKEDNVIYLASQIQKQCPNPVRGEVVYIDFSYKKDLEYKKAVGYKRQDRIKRHSREPTHSSYGFIL